MVILGVLLGRGIKYITQEFLDFRKAPITSKTVPGRVSNPMLKSKSIDKTRTKRLPAHARIVFRLPAKFPNILTLY